jgi:ABC-type branched-subunit amino acid transport system ATPase component
VFENLRCGVLWSWATSTPSAFLSNLDDANERAEQLMEMIKLDKKRDVLAMNLTYAEQRALEIGITIAGGANVILLDEPTAGMSKSETTRFIHLIKEVTVGKTLLTVEHDMGVVFGLADKIAVVVYGEVIAFDTPEAVRANARVQEAYLGSPWPMRRREDTDMLKIDNLHAYYGKSHVLHGVTLTCSPARSWPAGAQRFGPLHHRQGHHGPGGLGGLINWKGQEICSARKPYEIAHLGMGYVPESRDIFPNLTVHQNLLLGRRAPARAAAGRSTTCTHVPAPQGAPAHRGRRDVGRRAADADAVPHADGRPRPHHHRRAHRGPGAQDRRAGGRVPAGAQGAASRCC